VGVIWECDVDHGVGEVGRKDGTQVVADLGVGFVEAGDLRDAPAAAEPVTIDVEVPAA